MSLGNRNRRELTILAIALSAGLSIQPSTAFTPPDTQFASTAPTLLWTAPVKGWGRPAVHKDSVYFMLPTHEVMAVQRSTGGVLWRTSLASNPGPISFPMGSAVEATPERVLAGDYDIVGLDSRTGRLVWRFAPEVGYGPGIFLGAVANGRVYAGSPGGYLHAVDATTGVVQWSLSIRHSSTTVYAPVVSGDLVLAGFTAFDQPARGGIVAVDSTTGVERWRSYFGAWAGGPVVWRGIVIGASSSGVIYGLNRETGAQMFTLPHAKTDRSDALQDFRSLSVVRDVLIVGSLMGRLTGYRLPSLREEWSLLSVEYGSPGLRFTADEQFVYVTYAYGAIVAIEAETGRVRWATTRELGLFSWPPAVHERDVFAAGEKQLIAIR